ncbi:MAG: protein phosphatase 2C domain-containing protein [Pseudoflavonifractor sp.]|nr:protein phosphatase 2C domain-containing protein [Pseudoflavonifractor sp.]
MDLVQQLHTPDFITGFAESRIGGRSENQDSYGSADTPYGFVVTVCDGMGGGPGGKTASTIAVNEIINGIKEGNPDDTAVNILIKAIRRANLAIMEKGQETPALKGMGSTCTVLLISEESAIVAHVGDSRVYQLRGKTKVFRTFDHSMVFDLVRQKVITEEQARLSAQSNVITRALGIKPDIEVDTVELPYEAGDRFVLTTDGIHGSVAETVLIEMASDKKHALGTVTDEIATTIDGNGRRDGGGHDNLTIAIIETNIKSKLKSKMNTKTKFLFGVVTLICLLSLVFNGILLSRNNSSVSEVETAAQTQADSLKLVIAEMESVIKTQKDEIKTAQSSAASSIKEYESKVKQLEKTVTELNNKIASKETDEKVSGGKPEKASSGKPVRRSGGK